MPGSGGVEAAGALFEPIRIRQYEGSLGQFREILSQKVHLKIPEPCATRQANNSKSVLVTVVFRRFSSVVKSDYSLRP